MDTLLKQLTDDGLNAALTSTNLCDLFNGNLELGLFMGALHDYCEKNNITKKPSIPSFDSGYKEGDSNLITGIAVYVRYAKNRDKQAAQEELKGNLQALSHLLNGNTATDDSGKTQEADEGLSTSAVPAVQVA